MASGSRERGVSAIRTTVRARPPSAPTRSELQSMGQTERSRSLDAIARAPPPEGEGGSGRYIMERGRREKGESR